MTFYPRPEYINKLSLIAARFLIFAGFLFIFNILNLKAEDYPGHEPGHHDPPFLIKSSHWVDSVFACLSLDEKIAQLITVASYSNRGPEHIAEIDSLISKYKIINSHINIT